MLWLWRRPSEMTPRCRGVSRSSKRCNERSPRVPPLQRRSPPLTNGPEPRRTAGASPERSPRLPKQRTRRARRAARVTTSTRASFFSSRQPPRPNGHLLIRRAFFAKTCCADPQLAFQLVIAMVDVSNKPQMVEQYARHILHHHDAPLCPAVHVSHTALASRILAASTSHCRSPCTRRSGYLARRALWCSARHRDRAA